MNNLAVQIVFNLFLNAIDDRRESWANSGGRLIMMGIGFPELMIILVIIMIIFGAGKLPEIGTAFGNTVKNFKKSMKESEIAESDAHAEQAVKEINMENPNKEAIAVRDATSELQISPSQVSSELEQK